MRSHPPAVALVESPLQLLCTVEARAADLVGPTEVRLRRDVPTLVRSRESLTRLGLPPGVTLAGVAATLAPSRLTRAPAWVVGDAFSGAFQSRLATFGAPARLVLVDDGLATLELARVLCAHDGAAVSRVGAAGPRWRDALGRRTRGTLLELAGQGRLELFTSLPLAAATREALADRGVRVVTNELAWLAGRGPAAPVPEPVVVVGSALVADGWVHADAYVAWVRSVVGDGPARYLPHRRQLPAVVRAVAALPGVVVEHANAPVEIRLRSLGPGQHVVMLPSTALVLLGVVLSRSGTTVEGHSVPDDAWTSRAGHDVREHLSSVLGLARDAA